MQEADNFKACLEDKKHVVNIGGGVQGLETAWSMRKAGKSIYCRSWSYTNGKTIR